jgi:hypothetical protein
VKARVRTVKSSSWPSGFSYVLGGHEHEARETLEAVELSSIEACFWNAVGEEDEVFFSPDGC